MNAGIAAIGALGGYAVFIYANPVRANLREGFHCLTRHRQVATIPAMFAFAHALFRLWVDWSERHAAGETFLEPSHWTPPGAGEALAGSWLPAAENLSGLFNCLTDVFPLSAPLAFVFLINWRGYQGALFRAMRQRLGLAGACGAHAALVVCAAAAIVKPALFGTLRHLNVYLGADAIIQIGGLINTLGAMFEYLLAVGVQIYLVLLCFVWLRGLSFDFDRLRRFAVRRFSFVLKWSAVVLAVSTLTISLPVFLASAHLAGNPEAATQLEGRTLAARWLLAAIILACCPVQITLIFHNESLRSAWRDGMRFLRRHGWKTGWFLLTAFAHFLALTWVAAFLQKALGHDTPAGLAWALIYPLAWAILAGWLLASWASLFRQCETGHADDALL